MEIDVEGTASVAEQPHQATVTLELAFESSDPQEAVGRTVRLMGQVQSEVDRLSELTPPPVTWSAVLPVSTSSWRPTDDQGRPDPVRYTASGLVKVRFVDTDALNDFTVHAGAQEGVSVQGIVWSLHDERRGELEAHVLAKAVRVARGRARVIADAAGAGEVTLVRVSDEAHSVDQPMPLAFAARAGGSGPTLSPEDVVVSTRVRALFRANGAQDRRG